VLARRGGLDVTHVPDPATALDMVARQAWDVVVTDYDLPRMTGADLVAALRGADPALSVVLVSARDMVPGTSGDHHPDAHLAKPVPAAELLATVQSLIARKRH
jgi:CheY-like chemotaxis protein